MSEEEPTTVEEEVPVEDVEFGDEDPEDAVDDEADGK